MKSVRKRKMLWLNEWHIWEQEAWFSDMAALGWELIEIGKLFATFEQSNPKSINYRCDIFDPDDPTEVSRIELYRKFGWEHVASRKYIQVFKEVENGKSTEIPTDPLRQAETSEILNRGIKKKVGFALLGTILTVMFQFLALQNDPVGNYLADGFILFFIVVAIYTFSIINEVTGMVQMARLIKKLKLERLNGYGINYKWKIHQKRFIGLGVIFFIAILVIYLLFGMLIYYWEGKYPEIPQEDLFVVQLADVTDEAEYRQIKMTDKDSAYYNYYKENTSLFVPKQYELHQTIEVVPKDKDKAHSSFISSYRYESRNEWLAKKLLHELKEQYLEYLKPYKFVVDDRFDELWVRIDSLSVDLLVRKGNEIYGFSFNDMKPIEEIIERALVKIKEL